MRRGTCAKRDEQQRTVRSLENRADTLRMEVAAELSDTRIRYGHSWKAAATKASSQDDALVLQRLRDAGFPLEAVCSQHGATLLHTCADYGSCSCASVLLDITGVNANANDLSGVSPLHLAASRGRDEMCRVLLAHGAKLEDCTGTGKRPFTLACQHGFAECALGLVLAGCETGPHRRSRLREVATFLDGRASRLNTKMVLALLDLLDQCDGLTDDKASRAQCVLERWPRVRANVHEAHEEMHGGPPLKESKAGAAYSRNAGTPESYLDEMLGQQSRASARRKQEREAELRVRARFQKMDANADGVVSKEEFMSKWGVPRSRDAVATSRAWEREAALFASMDHNDKGFVTQQEYMLSERGETEQQAAERLRDEELAEAAVTSQYGPPTSDRLLRVAARRKAEAEVDNRLEAERALRDTQSMLKQARNYVAQEQEQRAVAERQYQRTQRSLEEERLATQTAIARGAEAVKQERERAANEILLVQKQTMQHASKLLASHREKATTELEQLTGEKTAVQAALQDTERDLEELNGENMAVQAALQDAERDLRTAELETELIRTQSQEEKQTLAHHMHIAKTWGRLGLGILHKERLMLAATLVREVENLARGSVQDLLPQSTSIFALRNATSNGASPAIDRAIRSSVIEPSSNRNVTLREFLRTRSNSHHSAKPAAELEARARFEQMDMNRDGVVTKQEFVLGFGTDSSETGDMDAPRATRPSLAHGTLHLILTRWAQYLHTQQAERKQQAIQYARFQKEQAVTQAKYSTYKRQTMDMQTSRWATIAAARLHSSAETVPAVRDTWRQPANAVEATPPRRSSLSSYGENPTVSTAGPSLPESGSTISLVEAWSSPSGFVGADSVSALWLDRPPHRSLSYRSSQVHGRQVVAGHSDPELSALHERRVETIASIGQASRQASIFALAR